MSRNANEQLLNLIGEIDGQYIQEYLEAQNRQKKPGRRRLRITLLLAAAITALFGTAALAAVPAIGHFPANRAHESEALMLNFDEIESAYAVQVGNTQECQGVIGTLNSAVVESHYLLLSYTFDWSGLEEAQNGSFHTWFLPWFFYITEGDTVICKSEYTDGLHTQVYADDIDNEFSETYLYCIDLSNTEGSGLVGKELTVRLLYSADGEGFTSAFTPEACFSDRSWRIDDIYEFGGHTLTLNGVQESALYVTLFIDCDTIGHTGDEYSFVLSDELGSDYTVYPCEDNDANGYWFVKPEAMGSQLTLKVIKSHLQTDIYGAVIDDSYDVILEIPVELKTSFWDMFYM